MREVDGEVILSATDLTRHTACTHATTLELSYLRGRAALVPAGDDPDVALIAAKGAEHETAAFHTLAAGRTSISIPRRLSDQRAEAATVSAMQDGVEVVYQAAFAGGRWSGRADFLLRNETPSRWGPWSYDVADTKLARTLTVPALIQMAGYAERLTELQGVPPQQLVVITGDAAAHPWRMLDVAAYARRLRRSLELAVERQPRTEPVPNAYCPQCRWRQHCEAEWLANDDLSQVAGLRRDQRQALIDHGVTTLQQLAEAREGDVAGALSQATEQRLRQQARLQAAERETGEATFELLAPERGRGLGSLPAPHPGDVYLDFEGDPWADGGEGREYLAGLWDRSGHFTAYWAHDTDQEKRLTEELLDDLRARRRANPDMHVYHYAPYEVAALKRLTGRHATREIELDQLLRGEAFVDLYAVVRGGVRISKPSYSIKKLEDFYWRDSRSASGAEVADAGSSILEYERWLDTGDQAILDAIAAYNRDDVRSTHDLHAWLEDRRDELLAGGAELTRPQPEQPAPPKDDELAEQRLADELLAAGHPVLAGMVGWHRREERPEWWDFFRLADLQTDELIDDRAAIGAPVGPELVGDVLSKTGRRTSRSWRYRFPPQECAFNIGDGVRDVDTNESIGTVLAIDAEAGDLVVKLGAKKQPGSARGFGAPAPINTKELRESLQRTGRRALDGGDDLALRLLDRRVPPATVLAGRDGEDDAARLARIGLALDGEVLAVQGPPGTGKTYCGAELIRQLVAAGRRVGVVAGSHEVIRNLLIKTGIPAMHKIGGEDRATAADNVTVVTDNGQVAAGLGDGSVRLAGGTAWLWSRPEMAGLVDVLVVDEAGQFSLANAAAVAPAARSMVLLGDPQQLRQPTKAQHPHGAGVSALEHLIGEHDTIQPDAGVFLATTWRMHPAVAGFVSELSYDGRLRAHPDRAAVSIDAPGLGGPGLYWMPVEHALRSARSPEEAGEIDRLIAALLTGRWHDGAEPRAITESDILVVAPFNAQVAELRKTLPSGVKVGTVDKFQGQEGAVVIYSLTASSAGDAPRGVDFLYDVHRLNVAVSRAKAAVVVVGSPLLLDAEVRTPEQLRAVNALCRYVEDAHRIPHDG
ncbi:TM0106 family RecB-like putative nuclease [Blastococcus sp. Marseille-P5729]|uniref:TM0106 family RecB-like putative nuclease n=1 Tax=Blastococcus sp. Marseille-P5729 TaxID=2086582 RepID=UPI000D103776|nr:TM0106 family RecB-like putative nuclease [Blastococcus sp. Marseille-P5729]